MSPNFKSRKSDVGAMNNSIFKYPNFGIQKKKLEREINNVLLSVLNSLDSRSGPVVKKQAKSTRFKNSVCTIFNL